MKKILAISSLLIVSNAALAADLRQSYASTGVREAANDTTYPVATERTGVVVPFNVAGIQSFDPVGAPANTVILFDAAAALGLPSGTPVSMTGIGWDVTITAPAPSWRSEMDIYFDDAIAPDLTGLFLGVSGDASPGGPTNYSSNGVIKLAPNNIADIVLPNGILRIEFFDSYDDFPGAVDGIWNSGTLNLQFVPEPASLSLLSLAALALLRRR